jgi:hypothetical protein
MEMKISTGKFEIINSGTIVGNPNESIEFNFQTLTFIIEFRKDSLKAESRIDKEAVDGKILKILLINFNSPLGTRSSIPISIGTIENRKLFLNLSAFSTSDATGHIFHYSFLLEKEA